MTSQDSMSDQVTPTQRIDSQDWASVGKDAVAKLTPADKGWILAFVILFSVMQVTNYLRSLDRNALAKAESERVNQYMELIESNRRDMANKRADEMRRMQELVKTLSDTVSRQADRVSRANEQMSRVPATTVIKGGED